ncbi:MAG TPA: tetratricopeptide repeat protein [Thermoanaerobaculia bacterium]|jgi:hypothetical protein|nr:tetratricopeptide repeat protein [Thermoanaerobaculia bacterium]
MTSDSSTAADAERLNEEAKARETAGALAEAIALYEAATRAAPTWDAPWFNLGLLYKRRRHWAESLRCNRKATELAPAAGEPAWWNLGIAATALGDWPTARAAWKGYGVDLPEGHGPIEGDLGLVSIRICPEDHPETLWCRRIDPARAVLLNVPLPETGRRWRDLILHDGAPNGYRLLDGAEVPVFDELELLAPSPFGTYVAKLVSARPEPVAALIATLDRLPDVTAEDWTSSIELLCRACSEGRPHDHHDHAPPAATPWKPERLVGIAARKPGPAQEAIADWCRAGHGGLTSFECQLPPHSEPPALGDDPYDR